ncbi:MAG: CDP-glycerol glycerophosphotransferase family protein [Dorea sp.]|nr:CDP-glycerol glycerophosphotransferase family protein [Dorea sp.]
MITKIKLSIIEAGTVGLNFAYTFLKLLPTRKKVTMLSRQSNIPSDEFRMIKKGINLRDESVKVVFLCHTLDGGVNSSLGDKIKYGLHMFVQMFHIATSKVVILDSYCMAVSILNHKKSLKVIQMWHSMGTMKKFGYTALDTKEGSKSELACVMKMHRNYDYIFASAESYKEHLAKGFDCEKEKILTMPLPRLDLLNSEKYGKKVRNRIYQEYPKLQEKPLILYCPTFRKEEEDFMQALKRLTCAVDYDKFNFVVKLHPLSKAEVEEPAVSAGGFTSFEMLFAADYVISDYSCIVYEAAVRGIPLYFYDFDMDLYSDGRGLALDYEKEVPGPISKDEKEIIAAIETKEYDLEALKRYADKYVTPVKHATKDIVDFVFTLMKE